MPRAQDAQERRLAEWHSLIYGWPSQIKLSETRRKYIRVGSSAASLLLKVSESFV